ncbi:MAG TPA: Rrf2 family transcriptional regulator [Planctomycetota bacterium]
MFDLPWSATRGLQALAAFSRDDQPLSAGGLARELHVPPGRAAALIRELKAAGLIAAAGHKGWALTRPAGDVTVFDALVALGAARPDHPELYPPELSPLYREANENLIELFRRHTLADLRAEMPSLP